MKKYIPSENNFTFLRIAFSVIILILTISILPSKPSYADDGNLHKYRLYPIDVLELDNKPDVIAYANTQHIASPPEFTIEISGKFWRYYEWISLTEKGSWIKATTNIATDCIGVQLWGDQTDGWARITVDGSEVWRGNTYGKSGKYPGEAFANYVEIYNLPMAKHTIIVDVLGINGQGGGPDVTVFFFGLRKATAAIPPQPAPPSPPAVVEQAAIDVWTSKGGQGPATPGGTFQVGEETIVYVQATVNVQARWIVRGPSMAESGTQVLQGGETYQWPLGKAEDKDVGQWQVVFEASVPGGQLASDATSFTVVATGTPPAPPAPSPAPITPPPAPTTTGIEEKAAKINAASATELDALIALKMAEGELATDLNMDADSDGKVTREDAHLILEWAIEGSAPAASSLLGRHGAYNFGEVKAVNLNPDGSASKYVYKLPTEEVAKDLFLDRSIEYNKTNQGYIGTLTLQFRNTGQDTKTYSHVERIPKSFAKSVNDLDFSVPPDQIINSDPAARWVVEIAGRTVAEISVKVKEAVTSAAVTSGAAEEATGAALASGFEQIGKALSGQAYDFNEAIKAAKQTGIEAGAGPAVEAAVGVVMENFDDFAFIAALNNCATLEGSERNAYVLQMVERFPNRFNQETCAEAFKEIKDDKEMVLLERICWALEANDITECESITDKANRDLCKGYIIVTKCDDIEDSAKRDECYSNKAGECGCTIACLEIKDQDKQNLCLAKVTGDKKYCENINSDEARDKCLGISPPQTTEEAKPTEKELSPEEQKMLSLQSICHGQDHWEKYNDAVTGKTECWKCVNGKPQQRPMRECTVWDMQSFCDRGGSTAHHPNEETGEIECWECVNGKPQQVTCK